MSEFSLELQDHKNKLEAKNRRAFVAYFHLSCSWRQGNDFTLATPSSPRITGGCPRPFMPTPRTAYPGDISCHREGLHMQSGLHPWCSESRSCSVGPYHPACLYHPAFSAVRPLSPSNKWQLHKAAWAKLA